MFTPPVTTARLSAATESSYQPIPHSSIMLLDLPLDVLFEIVQWSIGPDGVTVDMDAAPWKLGHVCSGLRKFVRTNPTFWRTITLLDSGKPWSRDDVLFLGTIICRSGAMPLRFRLESPSTIYSPTLLLLFMIVSERWESVDLSLPQIALKKLVYGRRVPPNLTTLRLHTPYMNENMDLVTMFHNAPKLHTVTLEGFNPQIICLPWNQLTSLTTTHHADSGLQLLRFTPEIREYTNKQHNFASTLMSPTETVIRLDHLHSLSLVGSRLHTAQVQLTLPNLDNASITFACDPRLSLSGVLSLLQRSHCALRRLYLHNIIFAHGVGEELIQILGLVDTLEDLMIEHQSIQRQQHCTYPFVAGFVAALTNTPKTKCLLPKLRDIYVDVSYSNIDLDMDWGAITRMWESRQRKVVEDAYQNPFGVAELRSLFFADIFSAVMNGELVMSLDEDEGLTDDFEFDAFDFDFLGSGFVPESSFA